MAAFFPPFFFLTFLFSMFLQESLDYSTEILSSGISSSEFSLFRSLSLSKQNISGSARLEEAMDSIYMSPNADIEDRIKDILAWMTLKEKIGQMTQIEVNVATPSVLKDFSIGTLLIPPS